LKNQKYNLTTVMKKKALLILTVLFVLPTFFIFAQNAKQKTKSIQTILFVCEHGAGRSAIAAAYFNKIAKEKGLKYTAIFRGIDPQAALGTSTINGLIKDNVDISNMKPIQLIKKDINGAYKVITLDCTLPDTLNKVDLKWTGIEMNGNYTISKSQITLKMDSLIAILQNTKKRSNDFSLLIPESSIPIPKLRFDKKGSVTTFLPNIVSTDSLDFGSAFSPNGKSFYFARSENKKSKIYVTTFMNGKWSLPVSLPFNDSNFSTADPAFSKDGKLYFISNRPSNKSDSLFDYNIWFVNPLSNGKWTAPVIEKNINSDSDEFYISFSQNGNLYFSSARKGGFGEEDIYVSKLVESQYSAPVNLGSQINSDKSEYDPCISFDETIIIFASSGRADAFGKADLYASKLSESRNWQNTINLGKVFNTPSREYCPYFSPDLKYFFYSSEGDIKWVDIGVLKNKISELGE
jgi:protein-tyrosine-phosphatase